MSLKSIGKDKLPFAEAKASSAFMAEAQRLLIREIMSRSGDFIPERNHQVFCHGRGYTYHRENREAFSTRTGHMQRHQQKVTVSIDRIIENDMQVLPDLILGFGEQTASNMAQRLEGEMTAVAEEVGNSTAVPQDHSMMEAFLSALDKGLWSIDSSGQLYAPRILLDPKSQVRLKIELATRKEEFDRRFAEMCSVKRPLAEQAEAERLKKYDSHE